MKRINYTQVRSIGLIATVVILIGHNLLPNKRLQVQPSDNVFQEVYGYPDPTHGQSAHFTNRRSNAWECNYRAEHAYGCGWMIGWDTDFVKGIDLSRYQTVEIRLTYTGTAKRIRVFMRNFDENYSTPGKVEHTKIMTASFRVEDGTSPVNINLNEFNVAGWWLRANDIPREWARPEFDNIVQLGFDLVEPGLHEVSVQQVTLIGNWISTRFLLLAVVVFWMAVFLIEGLMRFAYMYRRSKNEKQLIRELRIRQFNLEEEKENLKVLANHDPLTGVLNRTGIQPIIYDMIHLELATGGFGLLVLDLDGFKEINAQYGHDLGDLILKNFAALVSGNLRETDHFARWSGEEFIIISQHKTFDGLQLFANKLRSFVASTELPQCPDLQFTVSIGATLAKSGDNFDAVFKRADAALHRAKELGRNRVELEV